MLCPAVVGVGDAGDSLGVTNAETVFDPPPEIEIVISDVKASYIRSQQIFPHGTRK